MKLQFVKMNGLGNDYIIFDLILNTNYRFLLSIKFNLTFFIKKITNRNFSIGSDGVIFLIRKNDIFEMVMYNSDGSRSYMCGNGLRCLSLYIFDYHLKSKNIIYIKSGNKIIKSIKHAHYSNHILGSNIELFIDHPTPMYLNSFPSETFELYKSLNVSDSDLMNRIKYNTFHVSMGNPHYVIDISDFNNSIDNVNILDKLDIKYFGSEIEQNNIFENKTNVEFITITKNISNNKLYYIDQNNIVYYIVNQRTWERNVGETNACGSGACAVLSYMLFRGYKFDYLLINLLGGVLKVSYNSFCFNQEGINPFKELDSKAWSELVLSISGGIGYNFFGVYNYSGL